MVLKGSSHEHQYKIGLGLGRGVGMQYDRSLLKKAEDLLSVLSSLKKEDESVILLPNVTDNTNEKVINKNKSFLIVAQNKIQNDSNCKINVCLIQHGN